MTEVELERRRIAERGFWKEMEERGLSRLDALFCDEHFERLRDHFSDDEIVEIVSVISLFGWLNRWNDTMATTLEPAASQFATENLGASGWEIGAHA